jgi:predicted acyltransferase
MNDHHPKAGRLVSVDALRGFDMFWIVGGGTIAEILAKRFDSPAGVWVQSQLKHAAWEGFHFEDLIMPLFLFLVGVVMPFSFDKRLAEGSSKLKLYGHIILRVVLLWILGMIKQGNLLEYNPDSLKLYSNTLQAIAAGYLITAVIILHFKVGFQYLMFCGLLLGYWALLMWAPIPGGVTGSLTPEGNFAIYVDKLILGRFQDGTPYTWILSSMTFAATVLLGVFSGRVLKCDISGSYKAAGLVFAGLVCILVGWVWDGWFTIIKHLWTSSFVFYSGGMCMVLLGVFYFVIDVWGLRKWAYGFVVIGANAIVAYMADCVFDLWGIANRFVGGLDRWTGDWTNLVHAIAAFAVLWVGLWFLYRHRLFVKV